MKNIIRNTIVSNMTSFTGVNRDGEGAGDGEGVGDGAGAITTDSWKQSQMSSWDSKSMLVNNSNMAGGVREEDRSDRTYYTPGTSFGKPTTEEDKKQDLKTGTMIADSLKDDGEVKLVEWNGENTINARKDGAEWILEDLKLNPLKEGEQLNLVGFSHGGNVVNYATWLDLGYKIDNIVFLATPQTSAVQPNYSAMSGNGNIYNFYGVNDKVQDWIGGVNGQIKVSPPSIYGITNPTNPSQTLNNSSAINIQINQNPIRNFNLDAIEIISPQISNTLKLLYMQDTHKGMHSDKTVDKYVVPVIKNNNKQ